MAISKLDFARGQVVNPLDSIGDDLLKFGSSLHQQDKDRLAAERQNEMLNMQKQEHQMKVDAVAQAAKEKQAANKYSGLLAGAVDGNVVSVGDQAKLADIGMDQSLSPEVRAAKIDSVLPSMTKAYSKSPESQLQVLHSLTASADINPATRMALLKEAEAPMEKQQQLNATLASKLQEEAIRAAERRQTAQEANQTRLDVANIMASVHKSNDVREFYKQNPDGSIVHVKAKSPGEAKSYVEAGYMPGTITDLPKPDKGSDKAEKAEKWTKTYDSVKDFGWYDRSEASDNIDYLRGLGVDPSEVDTAVTKAKSSSIFGKSFDTTDINELLPRIADPRNAKRLVSPGTLIEELKSEGKVPTYDDKLKHVVLRPIAEKPVSTVPKGAVVPMTNRRVQQIDPYAVSQETLDNINSVLQQSNSVNPETSNLLRLFENRHSR